MDFKISEFFYHLLSYGGFSFREGNILLWGDPDIMLLPESFLALKGGIEKSGSKDAEGFFYWLGKSYGRDASTVLVKKFGFSQKDFDKFTNGGTQDGYGLLKISSYPKEGDKVEVVLEATNCIVAELAKSSGKKVDEYLCGMVAGGSEPVFGKDIMGVEEECVATGASKCIYRIKEGQDRPTPGLVIKSGINQDEINKRIIRRYMNRSFATKFMERKQVNFGDGGFALKGVRGVLLPISGWLILDAVCSKALPDYKTILLKATEPTASKVVEAKPLSMDMMNKQLSVLDIFGLGEFRMAAIKADSMVVSNSTGLLPIEHIEIIGKSARPICRISEALLTHALSRVTSNKVSVEEIECIAQGKKRCLFKAVYETSKSI